MIKNNFDTLGGQVGRASIRELRMAQLRFPVQIFGIEKRNSRYGKEINGLSGGVHGRRLAERRDWLIHTLPPQSKV